MADAHAFMEPFTPCRDGAVRALTHRDSGPELAAALLRREGCVPADKTGRGGLLRFECQGGAGLLRPYRRGGLISRFVHDAYFLDNRPLRELRIHARLYAEGLPVPQPLGVSWRWRGPWVSGAIATREIDAPNVLEFLRTTPETAASERLLACGALIRRMHDSDVFHPDLQLRNILVTAEDVYLLDFDNARIMRRIKPLDRARNLLRLRRSIEKNGLPLAHFQPLCEGYGMERLPPWLERVYRAKGRASDWAAGRARDSEETRHE